MKRILSLLLMASLVIIPLTGCGEKEEEIILPPAYPVTVNGITIEQEPLSFASLNPAITDILLNLDELHRIVGYSDGYTLPDYPEPPPPVEVDDSFRWFWEEAPPEPEPYIEQMPNGEIGTALKPNLTNIGEYLPEVIFTSLPLNRDDLEKLNSVNIKVIELPLAKTIEQVKENYSIITKVIYGQNYHNEQTTQALENFDKELEYIYAMLTQENVKKPTFMYVPTTTPFVATPDTMESELFSVFATNVAKGTDYTIPIEEIGGYDPDYLFYPSTVAEEYFYNHDSFNMKSAVIGEDNLIRINAELLKNQNMLTILDDVRTIGNIFYPNIDFVEPPPPVEEVPIEEPSMIERFFSFFKKDDTTSTDDTTEVEENDQATTPEDNLSTTTPSEDDSNLEDELLDDSNLDEELLDEENSSDSLEEDENTEETENVS